MNTKNKLILKYSNPDIVNEKANELIDEPFELKISTRKNKKYMIRSNFTNNKWVHFGMMGYEDYTKHNDLNRRMNFLKRNNKWSNNPINSPSFLSYYLLW